MNCNRGWCAYVTGKVVVAEGRDVLRPRAAACGSMVLSGDVLCDKHFCFVKVSVLWIYCTMFICHLSDVFCNTGWGVPVFFSPRTSCDRSIGSREHAVFVCQEFYVWWVSTWAPFCWVVSVWYGCRVPGVPWICVLWSLEHTVGTPRGIFFP
jgi:hypothetical protein